VHQFGGNVPRRRPREGEQQQREPSIIGTIVSLLPIIVLFIFPLLSSIFSGSSSSPSFPNMVFDDAQPPYTHARKTKNSVRYFVRPADFEPYRANAHKLSQLDNYADILLVRTLKDECHREMLHREHLREQAQGWFFQDPDKMDIANKFEMRSCNRLEKMKVR
jgi:DnaJ homolog subfamily B member 12